MDFLTNSVHGLVQDGHSEEGTWTMSQHGKDQSGKISELWRSSACLRKKEGGTSWKASPGEIGDAVRMEEGPHPHKSQRWGVSVLVWEEQEVTSIAIRGLCKLVSIVKRSLSLPEWRRDISRTQLEVRRGRSSGKRWWQFGQGERSWKWSEWIGWS